MLVWVTVLKVTLSDVCNGFVVLTFCSEWSVNPLISLLAGLYHSLCYLGCFIMVYGSFPLIFCDCYYQTFIYFYFVEYQQDSIITQDYLRRKNTHTVCQN